MAAIGAALRSLLGSSDNAEVRIVKRMTPDGWLFDVEFFNNGAEPHKE